jgi:hypothetical protein
MKRCRISQKRSKKISQKNVKANQSFHPYLKKFFIITYGLLKMSLGQTVPDPDLELISAKSLDFPKPKLFFKNFGHYAATSTYIHVIPVQLHPSF